MREVTQYTLLVAILAILIYIAVVITGLIATSNPNKNSLSEMKDANLAEYQLVSGNLDYAHTADMNRAYSDNTIKWNYSQF